MDYLWGVGELLGRGIWRVVIQCIIMNLVPRDYTSEVVVVVGWGVVEGGREGVFWGSFVGESSGGVRRKRERG